MQTLLAIVGPVVQVILPIFITILAPMLVALVYKLFQKAGLDTEALNRDALQQAITKGALEAVSRAGGPAVATSVSEAAVRAGVDQVLASVPGAISAFKVPTSEIVKRVEAQATAIVQTTPAIPPIVGAALTVGSHAAVDAMLSRIARG
jgi:hypothetical protein